MIAFFVAVGGYVFYVNNLINERDAGKKVKKPRKKDKTFWSIDG